MRNRFFYMAAVVFCGVVLPLAAMAENAPKALFIPTSGWLVGPASLASPAGNMTQMPCLMMNQYDNGFTLRFSGGNKHLLAVAVDFRQSAFKIGGHYPVTLDIPASFKKTFDAIAYNEAILILNAGDAVTAADLYKALSQSQELHLGVGGKVLDFALLGAADGLRRVDSCSGGGGADNVRAPAAEPGKETDESAPSALPQVAAQAPVTPGPMKQLPHPAAAAETAVAPKAEMPPPETPPAAQAGNDTGAAVDAMLARAASAPALPVQAPVAAPAPATPAPAPEAAKAAIPVAAPAPVLSPETAAPVEDNRHWQAVRGATLQEVLDGWCRQADVRLIWKAKRNYPLKESIHIEGTFEQATQSLLSQFSDEPAQPGGRIYNDPESKHQVLLVQ